MSFGVPYNTLTAGRTRGHAPLGNFYFNYLRSLQVHFLDILLTMRLGMTQHGTFNTNTIILSIVLTADQYTNVESEIF